MKTIVAVIGTPHAHGSTTVALVTDFLELVREHDPDVTWDIIALGTQQVLPCSGCWGCSTTGLCPIDDRMTDIQARVLGADAVLLGSPVHAAHVSAQMKAFIDRSFLWAHTLRLMGKPALTAVTAAFSSMEPAEDYLRAMLISLGALPVGALRRNPFAAETLSSREACRRDYETLAVSVVGILNGRVALTPTPAHHATFETMKAMVKAIPGGYARRHWEARHWFDVGFDEAMHHAI